VSAYDGDTGTDLHRFYTFDGDLHSYHDRAARRQAAAEHEAQAVADPAAAASTCDTPVDLTALCRSGDLACAVTGETLYGCQADDSKTSGTCTDGTGDASQQANYNWYNLYDDDTTTFIHTQDHGGSGSRAYYGLTMGEPVYVTDVTWSSYSYPDLHTNSDGSVDRDKNQYIKISDEFLTYGTDWDTAVTGGFSFETCGSMFPDNPCIGDCGEVTRTCNKMSRVVYVQSDASDDGYLFASELKVMGCRIPPHPAAASATATLSPGTEVYAPAPARRLYALEVAAAQTLEAPVGSAFDWASAWTVAAWLRLGSCPAPVMHWRVKATDPKSLETATTYATDLGGRIPTASELIDYLSTTTDSPWASYDSSTDGTIGVDGAASPLSSNQWTFIKDDSNSHGYNLFQVGNDPGSWYGKVFDYTAASWHDGTSDAHLGYQFAIVDQLCNVLTLVHGAAAANVITAVQAADLTPGAWTHVALTYDGSAADVLLHVDGGAGTSVAFSGLATGGSVRITGAAVDDLRVYASDLSSSVQAAGAPAAAASGDASLIALFNFDDTLDDSSGYNNVMTLLTGS